MNRFQKFAVAFTRAYSLASPLRLGKGSLQTLATRLIAGQTLTAASRDDSRFLLEFPNDRGWEHLLFEGVFETGTTEAIKQLVEPTDTVIDIGANLGWYTVLLAKLVPNGLCHSFEPLPAMFQRLEKNVSLNRLASRVTLNPIALSDSEGTVSLFSFDKLGLGHTSMSTLGRSDYTRFDVPMTTLDAYLAARKDKPISLVKMDVEGAEMKVLRGAKELLSTPNPPMWIIEMNHETASKFNYKPEDLLHHLTTFSSAIVFFRSAGGWGRMQRMCSVSDYTHGDNVLCVPSQHLPRLEKAGLLMEKSQ